MHNYLDEDQKKAVEILHIFKLICEKYQIKYFLLAGSALGAVRHQGFIPWDDDIDIGVFYEEWFILRKKLIEELPTDFDYKDNIIDPNYPVFIGNILYKGKNLIDVFMLVKWPSNKFIGSLHWQIKRLAIVCYRNSIHNQYKIRPTTSLPGRVRHYITSSIRKIIYFILHFFCDRDDFIKILRWNEKYFMDQETDYYINIYSVYSMEREMIKKEWLQNTTKVIFEGEYYSTVSDTDAYLTHLYGDYMTPPPIKDRVKLHGSKRS